jgi:hypothetical protein
MRDDAKIEGTVHLDLQKIDIMTTADDTILPILVPETDLTLCHGPGS